MLKSPPGIRLQVVSGLFGVFLRVVETTIRQNSPDAPPGARFGAVAFVHRFGSYLNSHVHLYEIATDGVFSADAIALGTIRNSICVLPIRKFVRHTCLRDLKNTAILSFHCGIDIDSYLRR